MADLTDEQPLFSDQQLQQLRGVVREEVEQIIEEKLDPKFAAIQKDLTTLKAGQERLNQQVGELVETTGVEGRIQKQIDNHEDRIVVLATHR